MVYKRFILLLVSICLAAGLFAREPLKVESIVISTDRDVYVAGERLYFCLKLSGNSENISDYIYITLTNTSGSGIFSGCLKIKNSIAFGSIYLTDTLTTGIYQLVSFTNCLRNYGTSFYARKNIIIANRFDNHFPDFLEMNKTETVSPSVLKVSGKTGVSEPEIITDKSEYRQREKVTITLNIPDNMKDNVVSLSVRQVAPVSFIVARISLEKSFPGKSCFYLSEKSGMFLQGKLKNENKIPVQGIPVFLSCEDSIANLQYALTNDAGIFRFFLNPYYFGKSLVIKSDNNFRGFIEMDNKFIPEDSIHQPGLKISGDLTKYIENSQKYFSINYSYHDGESLKEIPNPDLEKGYRPAVYSTPGQVVYPSDFTYLPDFMEISREILPLMKTRERNKDYVASILDLDLNEFTSVYIFVDGILIEDVGQIISFDSKKIKKTETLPNERLFGELNIPSILSITTANHEVRNLQWKLPVEKMQADSLMHPAFYFPAPASSIPRYLPDFRQLLFWEPSLDCTKNTGISFETFTSDCTGEFEIVLTCKDENGYGTEYKKIFNVMHQ